MNNLNAHDLIITPLDQNNFTEPTRPLEELPPLQQFIKRATVHITPKRATVHITPRRQALAVNDQLLEDTIQKIAADRLSDTPSLPSTPSTPGATISPIKMKRALSPKSPGTPVSSLTVQIGNVLLQSPTRSPERSERSPSSEPPKKKRKLA